MFIKKQIAKLTLFCLLTTLFLGIEINPKIDAYASTTNMKSNANIDMNSTTSSAVHLKTNTINNYARVTSNSGDYNWKFNIIEVIDPITGGKPDDINGKYIL